IPLGFGYAGIAHQRGAKQATAVMKIVVFALALSIIIEVVQIALPTRVPSVMDVASNTLGAVLGSLAVFLGGGRILNDLGNWPQDGFLSTTRLATIFIGYVALTVLLSASLQHAATLRNWDEGSTLTLGNYHYGDRPWEGPITRVEVANKAADEGLAKQSAGESLARLVNGWVFSYDLRAGGPYRELTGRLPALGCKGQMPLGSVGEAVATTQTAWLETEAPVSRL